jgi:hypothetical protein
MQDLQRKWLSRECVVLVACLQELIVIAVLIEIQTRDFNHVKIRPSALPLWVIRVSRKAIHAFYDISGVQIFTLRS